MTNQTESPGSQFQLTTRAIKWIALFSMLCDHFAKVFLIGLINHPWPNASTTVFFHSEQIIRLYEFLPYFGRLAFPLFVFLLVEGFYLTKNRWKYLRRIFIFALISEIPFDMGFRYKNLDPAAGKLIEFSYQNVLFTLAIGLFAMILIEMILTKFGTTSPVSILIVFIAIGSIWLGNRLDVDYHAYGVAAILIAYAIRKVGSIQSDSKGVSPLPLPWRTAEMLLLIIPLILMSTSEVWGLIDVALIALYSGRRGGHMNKWFFYAFYPAHFFILALLRIILT